MLHDQIDRATFWPLPDHSGQSSAARRVGVEIEFAGLGVAQTAELVARLWGGVVQAEGPRRVHVAGGCLGDMQVELDISLQKVWIEDLAAQALGDLVPVEIVTAPLQQDQLDEITRLADALHAAGGLGTQARLAFGFGVHLNPELPERAADIVAIIRAYGVLEEWLRGSAPLDPARRVLPFVDPWPPALIEALADQAQWDLSELARLYAILAPARGYGLDLLPAFEHLCPDVLTPVPLSQLKGGRPTFHYRLAESRLGDPDWSLAYEWNRWVLIERVATDADLLAQLAQGWRAYRDQVIGGKQHWISYCEDLLASKTGLMTSQGLASG